MISCIIYSYLNFIIYTHRNNMKLVTNNRSNYNLRSMINNTYTRKNNPNEYGNLVESLPLTRAAYINKDVSPIINRTRQSTMIIDKVTDYIAIRNVVDYITWVYIAINIFSRWLPPPPPRLPHPPPHHMNPNMTTVPDVLCTVVSGILTSITLVLFMGSCNFFS